MSNKRRGMVLIIVLVVVLALSLAAYTFSDLMLAHRHATQVNGTRIQTRYLVDSGVEVVKSYLALDPATQTETGGHYDNPAYFQGVVVIPETDLKRRGSFTVLAPFADDAGQGGGIRYGLEDESSRLNLNIVLLADQVEEGASRTILMALPWMSEDVADAILDWIDEDDETRDYGAEVDYYASLTPGYEPRNGPLQTVEELLLVRGVTPQLLFGVDFNRNAMVDAHEMSTGTPGSTSMAVSSMAVSSTDPSLGTGTPGLVERGWSAYLTLYSAEKNVDSEGYPRINLNGDDLQTLNDELAEVISQEWTNFILAYRIYGPAEGADGGGTTTSAESLELDLTQQPEQKLIQVIDLIGARISIEQQGVVESPFADDPSAMATYLPSLMDYCTVVDARSIPARININRAPREILSGIPGMSEEMVDEIMSRRNLVSAEEDVSRQHETWILSEAIVTLDEMRQLMPFVCAGGDVYRTQIVGYYQGGGPSARVELIFDATGDEPSVLFWRDISHLGRGYALETLGVDLMEQTAVGGM
ncbi:MAG: general secretion pathway protein GspK [Pirellulaceae bacterium]